MSAVNRVFYILLCYINFIIYSKKLECCIIKYISSARFCLCVSVCFPVGLIWESFLFCFFFLFLYLLCCHYYWHKDNSRPSTCCVGRFLFFNLYVLDLNQNARRRNLDCSDFCGIVPFYLNKGECRMWHSWVRVLHLNHNKPTEVDLQPLEVTVLQPCRKSCHTSAWCAVMILYSRLVINNIKAVVWDPVLCLSRLISKPLQMISLVSFFSPAKI